ncbi:FAD/NAD(P)-binding protein [Neptunomonas qingdaonensis]|uniref:NAD(P)H-flavin reductase n=1 Tax=Neptunomonas qingdaonensis TaxID=1045558 RepID=A0A1I2T438_9GAMM|nr:FAD/NAD(P)-binding protein [Neptunomonas qingdaonensis]SFG59834.1 NAD(P)H-flavin reductase [Neptunomonas qingdaonensis]
MIPDIFYVKRRTEEYPGTFTLHIKKKDDQPQTSFQPGQFNMLYAFGAGEVPISMSGAPHSTSVYIHTIRTVGLTTQALERLREGDQLGVRGPFGRGWPVEKTTGKTIVIIAGGLGLAPLRPLIYHLLSKNRDATDIHIFYGAKSQPEMLYSDELKNWAQQLTLQTSVDMATPGWQGNVGAVTSLLTTAKIDPENTIAFICGPEVMMRFAIQELIKKNLPRTSIYLSMERNMKCATGHCGHCQWGPTFICKDGPVFCYEEIHDWFHRTEV